MTEYVSRTARIERWLSLAVGVAVIGAMMVSLYQASLARAQLRASAWPYVSQGNSWASGDYQWVVSNEGVGPAKIGSFRVTVDGRAMSTWNAALRALTGTGDSTLVYSTFGRGSVLPAGATRSLLTLRKGDHTRAFWVAAQTRLRAVTCYCSVYDECWTADSEDREPRPAAACAMDASGEFQQ